MKLSEILDGVSVQGTFNPETEISDIVYNSAKAKDGVMFVCLCGFSVDGHDFAVDAYKKGCRVFLCQKQISLPTDADVILCSDTRQALAFCSCNFFRHPSKEIAVIGITGTKGKTTTAHIVKSALCSAGIKCGIIGTVGAGYDDVTLPTVNTTPESYETQKMLRIMADAGCRAAAIEVSSLGLKFHRVDGMRFAVGIFTNLSPDHIGKNEHDSFEEYAWWKKQLFALCDNAVVNLDDDFCGEILDFCRCNTVTYGKNKNADYRLTYTEKIKNGSSLGVSFTIEKNSVKRKYTIGLPGEINAHNAAAAVATADILGANDDGIKKGLESVYVKGRCEIVPAGTDYTIVIDYAHNGVSLKSIIQTLAEYDHNRIIALYGSVGGRTQLRRQELGEVSGEMCDLTVITSDDPDFEDPEKIMDDIAAAIEKKGGKYVKIADRAQAIRYAMSIAKKGDILILAGKGHEEFMKINGKKVPFSERKEIFKNIRSFN